MCGLATEGSPSRLDAVIRLSTGLLLCWLVACAVPPDSSGSWHCASKLTDCRAVVIVYDSWHAAIVLRRDQLPGALFPELVDFPGADFIEFSWGDRDYFPDPDSGIWLALRAAFWSRGSVLHVVGFNDSIAAFYPRAEIIALQLGEPAYQQVIDYLSASFARGAGAGRAPARPGLYAYSRFYPATGNFSVLKTCNTWVAQALAAGGIPVSPGAVITASQLGAELEQLRRNLS